MSRLELHSDCGLVAIVTSNNPSVTVTQTGLNVQLQQNVQLTSVVAAGPPGPQGPQGPPGVGGKSGQVVASAFALGADGSMRATYTYATPFADNDYSLTLEAISLNGDYECTLVSKDENGFVVTLNTQSLVGFERVTFQAVPFGE